MRTTGIEWTEHTWNPFAGCNVHTAGCTNCYAMRQAYRIEQFGTAPHYQGLTEKANGHVVWTGKVARASDATMRKPLRIPGQALIFVNSMSDFWHPNADDRWRLEAIDVIRRTPQHQYQVLTKRPEEALAFFERHPDVVLPANFWLGVTVEYAKTTHRLATLRQIPAAIRFVSFEPLIGHCGPVDLTGFHWIITGGESGIGHRRCDDEWVRDLHRQSREQGVAHFFKQWGHWSNNPIAKTAPPGRSPESWVAEQDPNGKGGSLLDGVPWKEFPSFGTTVDRAKVAH
jgi:protein gp37